MNCDRRNHVHPRLSALMLVAGAIAVGQAVHTTFVVPDSIPVPAHLTWNIAMLCALAAAALWNVARPRYGGYAVMLVAAVMTMTVVPVPLGVFALAIVTLISLTFLDPVSGCATGVAFGALMITYGRLVPLGIMGRGSAFTFDSFVVLAIIIGVCAHTISRYTVIRRRDAAIRRNLHIARELHDHTTNDLSDIIMLINRRLAEASANNEMDCNGPDNTGETANMSDRSVGDLETIRSLALDALHHTRHTIATLDGRSNGTGMANGPVVKASTGAADGATSVGMDHTAPAATIPAMPDTYEHLSDTITEHRERLRQLGHEGEVITIGDVDDLPTVTRTLVADFLRELFGNIVRHADPARGYTMLIMVSDDMCIIDLSDFAATDNSGEKADVANSAETPQPGDLRSGLARYRGLIEHRHGVLEITDGADANTAWTLHASIPLDD